MLKKIISGGQTGADQGALEAASLLGLETGGKMPRGFKTENGPDPAVAHRFGLEALASEEYPPRTRYNVVASDGTVIFGDLSSLGSRTTRQMCIDSKKPCLVVEDFGRDYARLFCEFLSMYNINTLNVAGNRESRNPGIQRKVYNFLVDLLEVE